MDRWKFNTALFSRLSDVLDITGTEIARRCGLRQQVLSRYTTNEIVVSVQVLIKLCNALRMPAHFFVAENNNFVIPIREEATIPLECWQPIEWNAQAVEQTFGDGDGRIYWKDVAVAMDVSSQKPHERFTLRRRFKVTDFLHTCSVLNISPFKFLIDSNRNAVKHQSIKAEQPYDLADLRQQLVDLSRSVADISSKYQLLFNKHNALLKRHNELEKSFHEYFGNSMGMAAEPTTDA